jgi:hypothetical protein
MDTFFPDILLTYLTLFRQHFSMPSYGYFMAYVWAMMMTESRKTVTNIAHACFFLDKHISDFERFLSQYVWDMNLTSKTMVNILLSALTEKLFVCGSILAVIDTTYSAKSSKKMIGIQKWKEHSSNPDRGEHVIGHHWAIAGLISRFNDRFLCWPIITRMISGKKNPSHYVSTSDGLRPETFWDSVIAVAIQTKNLINMPMRLVVDAYFANASFINPLLSQGIHVVTRWRKDGIGWDDPEPYCGRGRPRKHGAHWKLANLIKSLPSQTITLSIYGKLTTMVVVTRDMWLRDIQKKVRVVVVEGVHQPIIFISTDLTLLASEIIQIYSSRFSVEIAIRELKHHFGFGDYQCTTTISILRFIQLSCISMCLWRLMLLPENASSWLSGKSETVSGVIKTISETELSFARARRGLKRFVLKRILFCNSASLAELEKMEQDYEPVFRIAD